MQPGTHKAYVTDSGQAMRLKQRGHDGDPGNTRADLRLWGP